MPLICQWPKIALSNFEPHRLTRIGKVPNIRTYEALRVVAVGHSAHVSKLNGSTMVLSSTSLLVVL